MRRSLCALVLLSAPLANAAPVTLEHSGYLLDALDAPVDRTGVPMSFSIWDDATSTSAANRRWPASPNACAIDVKGGYFSVSIGSGCAPGLDTNDLPPGAPSYLEIVLDGVTLHPRVQLVAAPVAHFAADSALLGGLAPSSYRDASLLTGTVPAAALGNALVTLDAAAPLAIVRAGSSAELSIPRADATTSGYLAAADFEAFSAPRPVSTGATLTGDGTPGSPLAVAFGTTSGTAARGDDPRLSDARAPTGSAGGDLAGAFPSPTVAALAGRPLATAAPASGQVLQWDGSAWTPATVSSIAGTATFNDTTGAVRQAFYVSNALVLSATDPVRVSVIGDASATIVRAGTDTGARLAKIGAGETVALRLQAPNAYTALASATLLWADRSATFFVETGGNVPPAWAASPADGATLATPTQYQTAVNVQLVATDAEAVTFTLQSGALPTGVTLSSAGLLGGIPTVAGAFAFTVRATDSTGLFSDRSFQIDVTASTLVAATHWRLIVPSGSSCPGGYIDLGGNGSTDPYNAYSGTNQTGSLSATVSFGPGTWYSDPNEVPTRRYSGCAVGDAVQFTFATPQIVRSMRFVTVNGSPSWQTRFPSVVDVQFSVTGGSSWQTLRSFTTNASTPTKLLSDIQ